MTKRPILIAAVALTMAVLAVLKLCPELLLPKIPFGSGEQILITGEVLRTEKKAGSVSLWLNEVMAGDTKEPETMIRIPGQALLVWPDGDSPQGGDSWQDVSPGQGGNSGPYKNSEWGGNAAAETLRCGNRICAVCVCSSFREARNFGNFDEAQYYHSLGVFLKARVLDLTVTERKVRVLRQFLADLRTDLTESVYQAVPDPEIAGILAAVCTGDRSGLTDDTRLLYRKSGIIHILAVSGLHISFLGLSLFRLLRRKCPFLPAALVSSLVMLGFCIMSSSSPSAVRATIMFLIQLLGIGLGKTYDILCSLSFAAILMLLSNPLLLLNSAFQMSFSAILGVGILYRTMLRYFHLEPGSHALISGFCMSLSVTLVVLPLTAGVYFEVPLYSVLLNLLVVPLMSVILGSGLASAVLGMVSLIIGRFFSGIGVFLVEFIRYACVFSGSLPGSSLVTGAIPPLRLMSYYGILGLMTGGMYLMAWMKQKGKRSVRAALLLPMVIVLVLLLFAGKAPAGLRISFLDVGQGDGILIQSPSGQRYLIDGGSTSIQEVAEYRMAAAIRYYGVSRIDYSIISHPDTDHISAVLEILEDMGQIPSRYNMEIRNLLLPYVPDNANYRKLIETAEQKGVRVMTLESGMEISDGKLTITCLHPDAEYRSESVNGYSAVLDLRYGSFSSLLTGDLEEDGEQRLLFGSRLDPEGYDLLKVAHHGSRFSSSQEFLDAVSPSVAVISAGVGNLYGHPHEETLDRLKQTGALVYSTSDCGEIVVTADRDGSLRIRTKL
ncbi:MAG: DNA internalization-related competence protein ComEC/Rec2 [Parasporobacterium sp.]|nr:DNA internalization-related competence protein ComEC/Rec2 [Parasporobacterium sp.]